MLYAVVGFKDGDLNYEDIVSWDIQGDFIVLNRSEHEHILIPSDAVTSVEIRVDKEADNDR